MDEGPNAEEVANEISDLIGPIITSAGMSVLVGAALSAVAKLTATNQHHSDITGDHDIHPTKQETELQKNEAAGSNTKQSMAQDDVSAQKGKVNAAETNAKAATGEATATESGATAVRTKAGASDIETKALKMM